MAGMIDTSLYADHLEERQTKASEALAATGYDTLVLSSGAPYTYFADDRDAPFETFGHFAHWCPMAGPHHLLVFTPGQKPRLIRWAPEDFWYEQAPLDDPFWLSGFELTEAGSVDAVWEALGSPNRAAYLGDEVERARSAGLDVHPESLTARLDWDRATKTPYEIACLDAASALGGKGHKAAKAVFDAGGSELEIHYAFVQAMGATDEELPYHTIVALDEKAAFLHYEAKRTTRDGRVLLIDAGGQSHRYASDITRTHVRDGADARFVALRDGMERLQKELCDAVKPGQPYGDIHDLAHTKIGALLVEAELLKTSAGDAVAQGYTRPFFPHGVGHHLGLQVHDVGGHLAGPDGSVKPPPEEHPFLRNTRTNEPGHVFTIEPGIYFIEMLLRPFREASNEAFNWSLIDELAPHGGIRIEDDVVVTEDGHRNLTRPHLP